VALKSKKEMTVSTKFAKSNQLICAMIALVAILIMFPFSQVQSVHASAASDPIVLVVVDVTSSSSCQVHYTRAQGASSITTSAPCLPGTAMKTEQVPLSQALAHHWFYLPLSSATPQQISALMDRQRQALQARLAQTNGTEERRVVAPSPAYSCGWNASTSTAAVLDGDTVNVEAFFYVASDCSTIILKYSNTWLTSDYYNPMYWQKTYYGDIDSPYCWTHTCIWGDFHQTLAPPYTYYRRNYNATESRGLDYRQWFCSSFNCAGSNVWTIDLGNLS